MSVTYNGEHSVAFLYKNNDGSITAYKSWDDLFLIPATNIVVKPAEPVYSYTSVPGTSVSLDTTELISEKVVYGRRTGTWDFYIDHDKYQSWAYSYKVLLDILNGNRVVCVLRDDQDTLYSGRLSVKSWNDEETYSKVSIDYDFDYIYDESISLSEVRNLVAWVSRNYIVEVPYAQEVTISPEHNPDRPRGIKPTGGYNYLSKVTLLHVPYAERLNSSGGATAWIACDGKDDGAGIPQHSEWKDAFRVFDEDVVVQTDISDSVDTTNYGNYVFVFKNISLDKNSDIYSAVYSGMYHPAIEIISADSIDMPKLLGDYNTVNHINLKLRYYLVKNGNKIDNNSYTIDYKNAKVTDLPYGCDLWMIAIGFKKNKSIFSLDTEWRISKNGSSLNSGSIYSKNLMYLSNYFQNQYFIYSPNTWKDCNNRMVWYTYQDDISDSTRIMGTYKNARKALDRGTHFLRIVVEKWFTDERFDVRAAITDGSLLGSNDDVSEVLKYLDKCPWMSEDNDYQVDIYADFPWSDYTFDYDSIVLATEVFGISDDYEDYDYLCKVGFYIIRK